MERVLGSPEGLVALRENTFVGVPPEFCNKCEIRFEGTGNVLYCEGGVVLSGLISFAGSDSLIVLRRSSRVYKLHAVVYNNCTLNFDRDCSFNGELQIIISEECSVFVGRDCMFSRSIWIRTADPHLIYDARSHQRINPSKDVFLGDHVWVAQDARLLKGAVIGSGSIVGASSLVAGKTLHSNSSWGGSPVRRLRDDIFWCRPSVHLWTTQDTEDHQTFASSKFIYAASAQTMSVPTLMGELHARRTPNERLRYLLDTVFCNEDDGRFFIARPKRLSLLTRARRALSG